MLRRVPRALASAKSARASKAFAPANTVYAFMQFAIVSRNAASGTPAGQVIDEFRLEYELFGKQCPMAVENFAKLCSGEAVLPAQSAAEHMSDPGWKDQFEPQLHYQGSTLHRIVPGFTVQGGDLATLDGTGEMSSVFGPTFDAPGELGVVPFSKAGLLGTAVSAPHLNGSQFFILTAPQAKHLDGTCICFGRVSKGLDALMRHIQHMPIDWNGMPLNHTLAVAQCGIL